MDMYDSRFFFINKNFLISLGIWPYDTQRKYFIRVFHITVVFIGIMPQILSIRKHYRDCDRVMENFVYLLVGICGFFKILTLALAQKKLQTIFDGILDNWLMIVDKDEKQILRKYSERGRRLTIVWSLVFAITDLAFIVGPLVPVILNHIPLTRKKWPYFYLLNGEYFTEDRDSNYVTIYCWDTLTTLTVTYIFVATDTTFIICIEHCLGLFDIVRHRIQKLSSQSDDVAYSFNFQNNSYDWIVKTIKLHQKTLKFLDLLQVTYSTICLFILGYTVLIISLFCILMFVNLQSLIQTIRLGMLLLSGAVHLLVFCWPGERLIHISSSLVQETYFGDWPTISLKSKKALLLFMMRCSNPSKLTARGLVIMNYENFSLIMKTAASYIMVLVSLRKVEII